MARVTGPSGPWMVVGRGGLAGLAGLALVGCFDAGEPIVGASNSASMTTTATTTGETTTTTTTGTTTTTTGTTTDETTTTGEPEEPDAYRLTQLKLIDPHTYFAIVEGGECADVTNILNAWLADEIDKGDISQALVFYPVTPDNGAETPVRLVNAQCGNDLDTCSERSEPGDMPVMSVATNVGAGTCSIILPGTWNVDYSEDGVPNVANAPCFSTEAASGTVRLAGSDNLTEALELSDLRLTAGYTVVDGEVSSLVKGTLRGYLRQSDAMKVEGMIDGVPNIFNFWGAVAGGGGCQVNEEEPIDDTDPNPEEGDVEPGVWLYLNFEATKVDWLE